MLTSYHTASSDDLIVASNTDLDDSQLSFQVEVFPLEEELEISFTALIHPDAIEGTNTDRIIVNYATIKQEGIGIEVAN